MPSDPVYNPHLPSSGLASPSSASPWSSDSSSLASSSGSISSLAVGLIVGASVGAAVALMYAPVRGSELRRSLRGYASEGSDRLSHLIENGRCLAEDAVHRASALMEEGRRAFRTTTGMSAASSSSSVGSSQPLTASVAEISGMDRRFEEPLGG